jgi:hypothetical protein
MLTKTPIRKLAKPTNRRNQSAPPPTHNHAYLFLSFLPYHALRDAKEVSHHAAKELIQVAEWMEKNSTQQAARNKKQKGKEGEDHNP